MAIACFAVSVFVVLSLLFFFFIQKVKHDSRLPPTPVKSILLFNLLYFVNFVEDDASLEVNI